MVLLLMSAAFAISLRVSTGSADFCGTAPPLVACNCATFFRVAENSDAVSRACARICVKTR